MATSTDNFISVIGSYKIDPEDAAAFAKIAIDSVDTTIYKTGCLYYIASQDLTEPGLFHLSEGWTDKAALDEHGSSPEFKDTLNQAMKLRIIERIIYISESKGRTLAS